jgi:hypothetical protein
VGGEIVLEKGDEPGEQGMANSSEQFGVGEVVDASKS